MASAYTHEMHITIGVITSHVFILVSLHKIAIAAVLLTLVSARVIVIQKIKDNLTYKNKQRSKQMRNHKLRL